VGRWLSAAVKGVLTVAVTVLLAGLLVGFTTASSGERTGRIERTQLAGQTAQLTFPSGEGTPKGVIVWFHGQGGNAANRVAGPWLESLRRAGWVIASSDFHFTSWAEEETGLDVRVWVSGSMGGAVALNALNFGVQPPACWYGVKPAINLRRMDNVPGGRRFISAAYEGEPPVDRDPVRNLDSLPTDVRYRVVASKDDHWVLYDENSGPLISTLTAKGADVTLLRATGLHEDPSHFNASDLVEFAETCRADAATSASE
jgi:hypothetical protein